MVYRELKPEEFKKIPEKYRVLQPGTATVVGAFDGDELVGIMGMFTAVQVDPVWVREDRRGSSELLKGLTQKAHETLRKHRIHYCYTWIMDGDEKAKRVAERFGARPHLENGSVYVWEDKSWVES